MKQLLVGILPAAVIAALLASAPALAQRSRHEARKLAEHPFIPSVLVDQPFNTRDYNLHIDALAAQFDLTGLTDPHYFTCQRVEPGCHIDERHPQGRIPTGIGRHH